ncbi:beta strand repeat-containing protein [Limnoglobus roseus]|uniref:VCBS repeat-containing protein n=1 Tax=Limnoglobus roseus TaxID=2598579 RepID=A0A5C1AHZ7_9BACT|nr:VCBS repeat-containing protein [Limnoglobus roseus]QEL16754.1 VCBS repeat-containing protein [Limnoglobus roseus]
MLSQWCRKLFGQPRPNRRVRRAALPALGFESLEAREVPAFLAPISYGGGAGNIAVGDLNNDGRDDMAVASNMLAGGSVGVMLGNADGSFAPLANFATGSLVTDVAAGDLNGDGKKDLVVAGADLGVLLGNGDGTFGAPTAFPAVGFAAHSVKVGDFNNDAKFDVATITDNSAAVYLGNGDGTLQAGITVAVAGNNINLVVGDYDRDGNLDMATSNTASVGTISVLHGHGDGSFDAVHSYPAFSAPVYLGEGDFNHDGYMDFAVPNSYSATSMSVIMNNGDGTYAPPHTYGIGQTGYEIEVADFNNDGNDDFAVRGGSQYMVSLGKGDGTFYPSVAFNTPAGRFEAGAHGDFNGDGAVDLAYPTISGVTVVANDHADYQNLAGAVTFQVTAPATTTSGSVLPMTVTAVDGNGNVATGFRGVVYISSSDPAATTATGYAFNPLDAGIPYVFTAADAGTHAFTGAIRLVTGGDQTVTLSAPNMFPASAHVTVTGQVSKLAFSAPVASTAGDTFAVTVTAVDTQGAVATGYSSRVHFASTDALAGLPADYTFTPDDAGSHTFTVTMKSSGPRFVSATEVGGTITGGATVNVAAAAAKSLVLAGGGGAIGVVRPLSIVANDVYGNVAADYAGTVHVTSSDPAAVLPADVALVNGVATVSVKLLTVGTQTITATDVAAPTITGTVSSDATPPVAALFTVTGFPATVAGVAQSFKVTVRDTIGQVATGYTGTVYFSSSDVQAGLPASYTFTAADAGVKTFTATLKTAGTQSLTVRDLTGTLVGSQAGIAVTPAAFGRFILSVPNGTDSKGHILVTAGDAISLTVRATDAFGNTIVGYKGKVNITSTDAQAGLPSAYNFTAADAGVHTFTVVLKTATPNSVLFSFNVVDAANAASLATITNFEVVNAAAVKFVLNTPTNATTGTPFTFKVTALDAYGNTVKNYFGTVHIGSAAAGLGLPADYTFSPADAGVHTFTATATATGNATVTVSDVLNASLSATSSTITIKSVTGGGSGGGGSGGGKKV